MAKYYVSGRKYTPIHRVAENEVDLCDYSSVITCNYQSFTIIALRTAPKTCEIGFTNS